MRSSLPIRLTAPTTWPTAAARKLGALTGALGPKLVARHQAQIRRVDEDLRGRDAHRQDIGDVVVGHLVLVAIPRNTALDVAEPIDDARGVVGVAR